MKRIICLLLCLVLTLGLLPVSALADAPALDDFEARGNLVKLPVTLEDGTEVYLGVGECWFGNWSVVASSKTSEDTNFILSACLWQKITNNGTADYTPLSAAKAEAVFAQLSDVSLSVRADSGNENPNTPTPVYLTTEEPEYWPEAVSSGMQKVARYTLAEENEGSWVFTASCKVGQKTYSASGTITRKVVETITINGKDVTTVNEALEEAFENFESESREYSVRVELNPTEYFGQIIIPESTKDVSVTIKGQTDGEDHTILEGGISSENVDTIVDNVHFKGSGAKEENWPSEESNPNSGAENSAFYGNASGAVLNCIFDGYYYAVKCTYGFRACGFYNTFVNNHIAWYLDHQEKRGGNTTAASCIFAGNDIAIWVETFSMKPSFYRLNSSKLLNNETDIKNSTGYRWFTPGNLFVHISLPNLNRAAQEVSFFPLLDDDSQSQTCPYPMAAASENEETGEYEIIPEKYVYDQIDEENGDTISNTLASSYPIPESALSGNMYHVADPDTDEILASMIFEAEQDAPAAASEAEPGLARLALAPYALRARAPESSFDATVKLTRPDASTIIFTMNDPCGKTVTLKIPCTFTDGSVLHEGTAIEGAVFDGKAVTFQTSAGGEYTITGQGGQNGLPGMLGSLLGAGALHALGQSTPAFADVPAGSYYASAAQWAQARGIVGGTDAAHFSPALACTRAQAVTMLYRAAGCPETVAENPFEDVDANDYFYKAVLWAVANGITSGTDETRFSPDAPCTRGQIVTFLHRAARCTDAHDNFGFTDVKTGAYCEDAVNWAVALGLTNGTGETTFSPEAVCTRAQIVTFLYRNR